jgi:hypothetical protein
LFQVDDIRPGRIQTISQDRCGPLSEGLLHAIDHRDEFCVLVGVCQYFGVDDEVPMRVHRRRRRVVRSITTFLVRQDGRIRIGARQLGRRLDSLPTPSGIGRGQLLLRFKQPLLTGLGVRQLRRQRGRRLQPESFLFRCVHPFRLLQRLTELRFQFGQSLFHFRRRPGLVPAVVRLDARAIEGHLAQADQPHRHGQSTQPTEQGFQLLLEACPKFAERAVVDRSPFCQPHEIHVVPSHIFQDSAGTDSPQQTIQNHAGHDPRVNSGLSSTGAILGLPFRPILASQQFVEDPHVVAVRDDVVQRSGNQHELAASQDWLCKVTHARGHPVPSLADEHSTTYVFMCKPKQSK